MPEAPIPPLATINPNPQFSAKAAKQISKAELETVWNQANRSAVAQQL